MPRICLGQQRVSVREIRQRSAWGLALLREHVNFGSRETAKSVCSSDGISPRACQEIIEAVRVTSKIAPRMRFGRLTVVSRTAARKWGKVVWLCRCDCGNKTAVVSRNLSSGKTRSCGCLVRDTTYALNSQRRQGLRNKIMELATKHGLAIELPVGELNWRNKVIVTCSQCGRPSGRYAPKFLRSPLPCRRCSKRMDEDRLRRVLAERMITLDWIEYPPAGGQGSAHCECQICDENFDRRIGELVSGNRGCPHCFNHQEMCARIILTHNLHVEFAPRQRPKWMGGLELDGLSEKAKLAFEYMGHHWHKGDERDWNHVQEKTRRCAANDVMLVVIWALADRPSWSEHLKACQTAVDKAGLGINLTMPPQEVRAKIVRAVPQYVRDRLRAIGHDPIEFDQRGRMRSRCRLSGKEVTQTVDSLWRIRGCRYCQSHPWRQEERRLNARAAASAMWIKHRTGQKQRPHEKITDEMVAYVRQHDFDTDALMRDEVLRRFGINVSQSGLQYARSGKTHKHLNTQYPPIRKSASPYTKDHAAVTLAKQLRD
jgi:hypothetical protein